MGRLRFGDWPMRIKLAALLVLASLLPIAGAAYLDLRGARHRTVAAATALLAARADQLAGTIDQFHLGYARAVDRIRALPSIVELCAPTPDRAPDEVARTARGSLDVFPRSDPGVLAAAVLAPSGRLLLATDATFTDQDLTGLAYVRQALAGAAIISDVYVVGPGEVAVVAYASPVRDRDQRVVGVAVLWVRAAALWSLMKASNERAGAGSFAVLFDSDGVRIGHTSSDATVFHPAGALAPARIDELVAEQRFGPRTRALLSDPRAFPAEFTRARAAVPDPTLFHGFAPTNARWSYGMARRFTTVPWTVFYMVPQATLEAELATLTRSKVLFALAVLVIALTTGLSMAAIIVRPIRALTRATTTLGAGDLSTRVAIGQADEIGVLARSFDEMAARFERQDAALLRSRDAAEAANRELESFSYSVAHDLRAPLRGMSGFAQVLLTSYGDKLDADGEDALQEIVLNARRMGALIDALLSLSRVTRTVPKPERIDLSAMALGAAERLAATEPARTVTVVVEPGLTADLDPALARNLIDNLLGNAWKFTGQVASARIEVGAIATATERGFFVRDDGAGFDMAYATKLFAPFQRLHTTTEFAGTGIGLATVQRIVHRHGGRVWAEGTVGHGATFHVAFPRTDQGGPR